LRDRVTYRPIAAVDTDWDTAYRDGTWDRLWDLDESFHHAVTASLIDRLTPEGRILDVGAGEGVLLHHLRHLPYRSYLGIDLSAEALARCRARRDDPRDQYVVADATRLPIATHGAFDVAVAAETLYYVPDPVAVFRQLRALVGPSGAVIVSMYDSGASHRIWELLEPEAAQTTGVDLRNTRGVGWRVRCYRFEPTD
jgi:SAM-dependent methyltransferase